MSLANRQTRALLGTAILALGLGGCGAFPSDIGAQKAGPGGAVADAPSSTSRTFAGTEGLSVTVTGLRLGGDAWSDEPLTLTANGRSGPVSFALDDESGGRILASDVASAVLVAGRQGGARGCTDVVRVTDPLGGGLVEVRLDVYPHPAEEHGAPHAGGDCWWVDVNGTPGALDAVLSATGLRGDDARANALAAFYVHRAVLRSLRTFFADLPVEFPLDPPAGRLRPADGSWMAGTPTGYSAIAIAAGPQPGLLGLALLDGVANENHEGNRGPYGVHPDQVVGIFNASHDNTRLPHAPVDASDVAALESLVYGGGTAGGRTFEIRRIADGLGRTIAVIVAHEIGHSLGLPHQNSPGSIMSSQIGVSPSIPYAFTPEHLAQLRGALPGVGRTAGAGKPWAAWAKPVLLPEGGVEACWAAPAGR
jgi:hypothetical protein